MKKIILTYLVVIYQVSLAMQSNTNPLDQVTPEQLARCTTNIVCTYDFFLRKQPIPELVTKLKFIKAEDPQLFRNYVHHALYLQNKNNPHYQKYKKAYAWSSFVVLFENAQKERLEKRKDYLMILFLTIPLINLFSFLVT